MGIEPSRTPPPALPAEEASVTKSEQLRERIQAAITSGASELDLGNERIGLEGAAQVAEALRCDRGCTSLTSVRLCGNRIGDSGAAHVAAALIAGTPIKFLDLRSNGIGNLGAIRLAEALRQCRNLSSLDLWFNMSITAASVDLLADALEEGVNMTWLRLDIDNKRIEATLARNRGRFLVLSVYVTSECIRFLNLGGNEVLALNPEEEFLSFKETGEKLAAIVGVSISRLRIALEDGRLVSPMDEPRSVAEMFRNSQHHLND